MDEALPPAPAWFRAARAVVRRLPAGRFRAFERLSRVRLAPFEDQLDGELGGWRYGCDLRNVIAREACLTGRTAPAETAVVRAGSPPGGTFVDVGANWGYFTLVGAHAVGPGGRVVALEPDPRVHAELCANVARNGIRTVTVLPVAAADREGEAVLSGYAEADRNRGVSSLVAAPAGEAAAFTVRTAPLDDLLDGLGIERADLVKIDVEGAEELVLRGMARGLAAGRYRQVLLELHPTQHPRPDQLGRTIYEMMHGAGYRGGWLQTGPGAERAALYGRRGPERLALAGIRGDEPLGAWPHQLWTHAGSGRG
ncbi:MAG TPA: FkbM family methyltransferase [Longimicrobium sp.]|nr:FkbM family methyltransferase [Longimicrobium sp.]